MRVLSCVWCSILVITFQEYLASSSVVQHFILVDKMFEDVQQHFSSFERPEWLGIADIAFGVPG